MTTVKGIDVSKWQGAVDFKKVKAAGYSFVILNAGYGRYISQKDKYFESNYKNAKAAGLGVGAYWYSYATTADQAKEEAKIFAQAIAGKQFEYPLAYDVEDSTQAKLSNTVINNMCKAFCDYMESLGYYVSVYSYSSFLANKISAAVKSKYDIWLAEFTSATKPSYKGEYGIWQHSSTGKVSGVNGNVDLNLCYKDYPTIMKENGLNGFTKSKTEPVYAKGDVNADGKIDSKDVDAVSAHVKGVKPLTGDAAKRADMNGDGKIDTSDITEIAKKVEKPEQTTPKEEWVTYTVQKGDTLWKIATQYKTTVIELARINSIKNANLILVGQVLKIKKK